MKKFTYFVIQLLIIQVSIVQASANTVGPLNMNVTAQVAAACTMTLTGDLAFTVTANSTTSYYTGAQLDASQTISTTCTLGTNATVSIGPGINGGGTTATRAMKTAANNPNNANNILNYGLFKDLARTIAWGTGSDALTLVGTGAAVTYTIYGRIPASQAVIAGAYTDTVAITMTY